MDFAIEFDDYMAYLMRGLGHADRHMANSITTLRIQLAVVLAIALGHCPHCSSIALRLRW